MTKFKNTIRYYIEHGKLRKLKSFIRKHDFHPSTILDKKGRTALHLSCYWQQLDLVSFLLQEGSDPLARDFKGNTSILTVLKAKPQSRKVYRKIIKTLLKIAPELLHIPNFKGKTCKQYLEDQGIQLEFEDVLQNGNSKEEDAWSRRLQDEAESEYFENWGDYEEDHNVPEQESYDEWADRLYREYRQKKEASSTAFSRASKPDKKEGNTRHWSQTDQAKFEARCQEEERQRHSEAAKRLNKKRKKRYERLCQYIFEENMMIHPSDIPEEDDLMLVLSCTSNSEVERKKYLREQQIKWHPDKFLQKCGHKISDIEKEAVLIKVNKISQIINSHLQA